MSLNTGPGAAGALPWYKVINKEQKSALIAGSLGWALDAFDTLLYAFTLYYIMNEWSLSPAVTGMVASFTLIAQAVGGMTFGIVADKIGRIKALTASILIFAVATGFCGLAQNIWQLFIARLIVGIGLGGEWTAGAALISETWPKEHRGKALGMMQAGFSVGAMLAALIAGPIIASYGWRALYFIGILPAFLVFYIRRQVKEPELWQSKGDKALAKEEKDLPLVGLFKNGLAGKTILGTLFVIVIMSVTNPNQTYMPTFLATPLEQGGAGFSTAFSSLMTFPLFLGGLVGYLTFGFISDRLGRKKTYLIYLIMAIIVGPLQFISIKYSVALYVVCNILYGVFGMGLFAGLGAVLSEIFPTKVRGTGMGFCYNAARIIASFSLTITAALAATHGFGTVLSYLPLLLIIAIVLLAFFQETVGKELD